MIITKDNQNIIGFDELNIHDMFLEQINYDLFEKRLVFTLENNIIISFYNVVDLVFKRCGEKMKSDFSINGWEEIPNSACNDQYIFLQKESLISNNLWTDELFAVKILFSSLDEIKLICQNIDFCN